MIFHAASPADPHRKGDRGIMIPFIVMRCPAYFSLILPPPFAFGAKVLNNVITANARFLVLIIEFPVVFGVYAPHTVFQRAESLMLLTQLRVPLHHPLALWLSAKGNALVQSLDFHRV